MVRHPEVFAKAQAEVDSVVGHSRLPDFGDRPSMPYIEAMLSECLRYATPAPLSTFLGSKSTTLGVDRIRDTDLPHRLMQDDEYNGYFLPKGSWVIGNIWLVPARFVTPSTRLTLVDT